MPTLSLVPEIESDVTEEFAVLQSPDLGIVQRRVKHEQKMRRLSLVWPTATPAELATLQELHEEVRGRAGVFNYQPVDDAAASEWRFAEDEFPWNEASAAQAQVEVTIEEAL